MSSIAGSGPGLAAVGGETVPARLRAYFFSDTTRSIQTLLGLIWLLDGALQFQSFMYGHGFTQLLNGLTAGQPGWVASSVTWSVNILHDHQSVLNTVFALVQVGIGAGLLYRRTVRPALAVSFVWALVVWWSGEAFGMMFMTSMSTGGSAPVAMASPLTGAPGAVLLYGLIGLIVWPGSRPGGLLGARGARIAWAALWLVMAWLWLQAPGSSGDGVTNAINAAPSGMSWLSTVQNWVANAAQGNGLIIAFVLALASAAIGLAVAANWHPRPFLVAAIALNLAYWVLGQGFGGIFAGGATDPNAGPLFVLFAVAMFALIPVEVPARATGRQPVGAPVAAR